MDEHAIRELIGAVKRGRLSRWRFMQTLVGFGVTAPMAAQILTAAGLAQAQPKPSGPAPTRRGGGGSIKLLYWAATTMLNPHLAIAPKDFEASQLFYEPLPTSTPTATSCPSWPRRRPAWPTAASGPTARGCSGA